MPITVNCPACAAPTVCPDEAAGRRVRCPRCSAKLRVPASSPPDWQTAPPPVRRLPAPEPDAATPEETHLEPEYSGEDDEQEPWYYRFIERYVSVFMWIGVVLCGLAFVAATVFCMIQAAALAAAEKDANATLNGGRVLFFAWVVSTLYCVLLALGIIYVCSWLLLGLDAARNLRRIRLKFRGD